jgi:hypothetical protein
MSEVRGPRSDDRDPKPEGPEAGNHSPETGDWKLATDYDKPAERVWLPSSSAWSRAAEPVDGMEADII